MTKVKGRYEVYKYGDNVPLWLPNIPEGFECHVVFRKLKNYYIAFHYCFISVRLAECMYEYRKIVAYHIVEMRKSLTLFIREQEICK